jgi:type VI secretion system protein ImpI
VHLNQLTLFITKSPEEYTGGKHIEMPESGGSLGRNPSNTVSLIDHNRFISGSHCLISIYGDTYYLSDVSTNGTLVNGNKLLKNQPISLYDGDTIILGRYEISIGLEKLSNSVNIAADISEETDSIDPLANLAEYTVDDKEDKGNIADLFKETRIDKVDSSDPVAHLNFKTQTSNDEHLLHGTEKKATIKPTEAVNTRQLLDDSNSVHAEFDIPNLIPEDWFSTDFSDLTSSTSQQEIPQTAPIQPVVEPKVAHQEQPLPTEQQPWEDVTQTIQSTATTVEREEPYPSRDVITQDAPSQQSAYIPEVSHDIKAAFFKGLGVSESQVEQSDAQFFQQMGTCLRLCINDLQKDLTELRTIKETEQDTSITNIVELMLSLNQQKLLSPNELIEQILDELDSHKFKMAQATNDVINQKLQSLNPTEFAQIVRSQSRLKSNGKLWKEYVDFYQKNNHDKVDISSSVVQQKIKEQYSKKLKA